MTEPHAEYTRRLAARRETVARLERLEERLGLPRLACMIAAGFGWNVMTANLHSTALLQAAGWAKARAFGIYLMVFQGSMVGSPSWLIPTTPHGARSGVAFRFGGFGSAG